MSHRESGVYGFSFIAGGLLVNELATVAGVYQQEHHWGQTALRSDAENLLQARTQGSQRRIFNEVRNRLQALTTDQMELLVSGTASEQTAVAWLAVCKAYRIVREFAEEVVRERFVTLGMTVDGSDFDRFLDSKSAWDPHLNELTDSTREKARTVTMRMLREAGIVSDDSFILPTLLSEQVIAVIVADEPSLYRVFPISDQDFARASA